jgi:hypothetical protein
MGREGENLPLARASRPSVVDAPKGVGCHAWRITRAVDCRSGTKGQPPLVFPRAGGPPGEGRGANRLSPRLGRVHRCATWHTPLAPMTAASHLSL